MARKRKITAAALNIRVHPHSQEIYTGLMVSLYNLRKPFKIYGDKHGMFSYIDRSQQNQGRIIGVIKTFTKVDTDAEWFDVESVQEATEEQVSEVNIPENLFPNTQSFYFVFKIDNHRLYVQTYGSGQSLSPNLA